MAKAKQKKKQEQGHRMEVFKELVRREPNILALPAEELGPISFMGQAAVTAYRSKIKHMNQLDLAEDQKQATLRDGQDMGRILLGIEARIGELCLEEERDEPKSVGGKGGGARPTGRPPKHERLGLKEHQMKKAQLIAQHPDAVKEIIAEAKANEDIPTKTAVLNKIAAQKAEERRAKPKKAKQLTPEKELRKAIKEMNHQMSLTSMGLRKLLDMAEKMKLSHFGGPEGISFVAEVRDLRSALLPLRDYYRAKEVEEEQSESGPDDGDSAEQQEDIYSEDEDENEAEVDEEEEEDDSEPEMDMPKEDREEDGEAECPHGFEFGVDTDKRDECEECKAWDICVNANENENTSQI